LTHLIEDCLTRETKVIGPSGAQILVLNENAATEGQRTTKNKKSKKKNTQKINDKGDVKDSQQKKPENNNSLIPTKEDLQSIKEENEILKKVNLIT
jgi:hypothetical protein